MISATSRVPEPTVISDTHETQIIHVHQGTYDSMLKSFFDELWRSWNMGGHPPVGLQAYLDLLNQFSDR